MKFAKLASSFQIHDNKCIVNYEIDVGESHVSWNWFTDKIFLELEALLIPIIKEFLQGSIHKCFSKEFDSSPLVYLAGASFHVAYFFKTGNYSVNPCLIRCERENKYKPVNVSSIKLIACMCQTSHLDVEVQQIFLQNQLKQYFGKSKLSPESNYGLSAYFTKTNVQNQLKARAIADEIPLQFKQRSNTIHCEQTENHNKTDLISVCDPFVSTQENVKRKWSDDDFEVPFKERSKKIGTTLHEIQPNRDLHARKSVQNLLSKYTKPRNSDSRNGENYMSLSESVSFDFGELESEMKPTITNEYKILRVKDRECADVTTEKKCQNFNFNQRKLEMTESDNGATKPMDPEEINRILNELDKPDPEIGRIVAESKSKKLASIFMRGLTDSSSKDDSFDLTTNKRFRKLKKTSVAKRKCDARKKIRKVKSDNAKNKTLLDWKRKETGAMIRTESDSDDSLPPAFDDRQPSRSDVSELCELNGKDTKEETGAIILTESDSDDSLPPAFDDRQPSRSDVSELCELNGKDTNEADSELAEIVTNSVESSVVKEMRNLTTEQLEDLIEPNKEYLKDIFRGKSYCQRHQDYIKGGRTRANLWSRVFLSMYTDSQADFVMETLLNIFCKNTQKYNDYVFKVLLTETLIKILMDYKDLGYDEAERMSFLARYT